MSYRIGFVVEQTLGHKTHSKNLREAAERDPEVSPVFMPLEYENPVGRLPVLGRNYSFRASLYSRLLVSRANRQQRLDALYCYTQVCSLFLKGLMRSIPTIISLDATPLNFDEVGKGYSHSSNPGSLAERLKLGVNMRAMHSAKLLIPSNRWAGDSLVSDYKVPADRVRVIDPGVALDRWTEVGIGREVARSKPNLLFVGGEFERKGGPLLLDVYRKHFRDVASLHLVTNRRLAEEPGVSVYNNLKPYSETLLRLFHEADMFILPSEADISPHVVREAMVAGLPLIANRVGAIPEMIEEGESGFVVEPEDAEMLRDRIDRLVRDPSLRTRMGARGREMAWERYDASKNNQAVLELLKQIARQGSAGGQ